MTENNSPRQRKERKESLLVDRDAASFETVQNLNRLRKEVDDPAAAEAIALLHAQINGDHPDYTRPPDETPFGRWHHNIALNKPALVDVSASSATVDVTISDMHLIDSDVTLYAQFSNTDGGDTTVIETATQTVSTSKTVQFSTNSLDADTAYAVAAVATADVGSVSITEMSDPITVTTNQQ